MENKRFITVLVFILLLIIVLPIINYIGGAKGREIVAKFDEAFNNMTSDRIEPMMNMFKKLNLQLVLIATAEKATSILPYCDITYSIVKSGNRNAIRSFEKI